MTLLEAAANAMATVSILLAGRNSVHTWWTGIVGCALLALLFRDARLYADVVLQGFFIATSLIGWWHWSMRTGTMERSIRRTAPRAMAWMTAVAIVAAAAYGLVLHRFTDAYAPFADSAVLTLSVLAQLLLMGRRIETWPAWLMVNSIAVPLYASRGLTVTAVLYSVYWVNALIAWRHWSHRSPDAEVAT